MANGSPAQACSSYNAHGATFLFDGDMADKMRSLVPDEFKLARAVVEQNIAIADRKMHREMYGEAASHLEAALSTIHDLTEAVSEKIVA